MCVHTLGKEQSQYPTTVHIVVIVCPHYYINRSQQNYVYIYLPIYNLYLLDVYIHHYRSLWEGSLSPTCCLLIVTVISCPPLALGRKLMAWLCHEYLMHFEALPVFNFQGVHQSQFICLGTRLGEHSVLLALHICTCMYICSCTH